jgi:hypothetical protein
MGLQVKLREVVEIDGVPQLVAGFGFRLLSAKPYPTGVVGLHYARQES